MTRLEKLCRRIRRASDDLARNEYPSSTGPYFTLTNWSYRTNLAERIDLAHAIFVHGNSEMRGSRCFDNCFEMGDGRAVATALARRAKTDAVLHAAIARDFGGEFPQQWLEAELPPS